MACTFEAKLLFSKIGESPISNLKELPCDNVSSDTYYSSCWNWHLRNITSQCRRCFVVARMHSLTAAALWHDNEFRKLWYCLRCFSPTLRVGTCMLLFDNFENLEKASMAWQKAADQKNLFEVFLEPCASPQRQSQGKHFMGANPSTCLWRACQNPLLFFSSFCLNN